jgi:hypothetical protein
MVLPAALAPAVSSWSSYYGDHQLVSVCVRYVHVAAIVVGGGAAVSLDRRVLRAARLGAEARQAVLAELRGSHRLVVPALLLVVITGGLMTAADLDTFLASSLFWTKLAFVVALLVNGALLVSAETAVERSGGTASWGRLAVTGTASLALWLSTVFVGIWLTVGA